MKEWPGRLHVALAYPDVYEEAICDPWMLALYEAFNRADDIVCERVYLPWPDMAEALQAAGMPLFALESRRALADFDAVLMILPGELSSPAALTLLDLAGLPAAKGPAVIGIGPATANPEPLAEFCDAFIIGEVDAQAVRDAVGALGGAQGEPAAGIYLPDSPRGDRPLIARQYGQLPPLPARPIVPFAEARHERCVVEMSHAPFYPWTEQAAQERPLEDVLAGVEAMLGATGYDHVLLTGWHSQIDDIVGRLSSRYTGQHIHFSFDMLPMNVHAVDLADRLPHLSRGPLNLDAGAGSDAQRQDAARSAFRRGWHILKLNRSVGMPGETMEDIERLVALSRRMRDIGREEIDGQAQVHVVLTPFIPRAHSACQRAPLLNDDDWGKRLELLQRGIRGPGLRLFWRGLETRTIEAALARGDHRVGDAIKAAWNAGMRRPEDAQNIGAWQAAFAAAGLDMAFYTTRTPAANETLPWQHIHL